MLNVLLWLFGLPLGMIAIGVFWLMFICGLLALVKSCLCS